MDPRLPLLTDIDTQLRHYLGQGVDVHRTLVDKRYARDVLLVCDGMSGTELPHLSRRFREASQGSQSSRASLPVLNSAVDVPPTSSAGRSASDASHSPGHEAGPPQGWSNNTSGFGVSRPPMADFHRSPPRPNPDDIPTVLSDVVSDAAPAPAAPALPAPWQSLRRWLTRRG